MYTLRSVYIIIAPQQIIRRTNNIVRLHWREQRPRTDRGYYRYRFCVTTPTASYHIVLQTSRLVADGFVKSILDWSVQPSGHQTHPQHFRFDRPNLRQ